MINLEEKIKESVLEILKEIIKIFDNLFLNCKAKKKITTLNYMIILN